MNPCDKCGVDADLVVQTSEAIDTTLWYPRQGGPQYVSVDLCDVRATDGLRIRYDFDRNGWSVEQPQYGTWASDEEYQRLGEGWIEVAFLESWAKEDKAHHARVIGEQERNDA